MAWPHPTRHKTGHFGDVLPSQCLGLVPNKLNLTQQQQTAQKQNSLSKNRKNTQVLSSSWDGRSCGHNRHGPKIGGVPLWGSWNPMQHDVTWSTAYLRTKWHLDPSNRLATIHQRHRQDRQDRTDNGPIAQGEPSKNAKPKQTQK